MAALSITAGSVVPSTNATIRSGTAGATITQGQPVYKDTADSNKYKVADRTAEASSVVAGIAVNAASSGQPIDLVEKDSALAIGATVAVGDVLVLSTSGGLEVLTAGVLTTGDYTVICGVGQSTTEVSVDFNARNRAAAPIA